MADTDETLFTAARRAVRDFNIDMASGGLIQPTTQHSIDTLSRMVKAEEARRKRESEPEQEET